MWAAFIGGLIGAFIGFMGSICFYVRLDQYIPKIFFPDIKLTKEEAKRLVWLNRIFNTALCLLIINTCSFIGVQISKENTQQEMQEYIAVKQTIEASIQNDNISGFERMELIKQASEKNAELAKVQYRCRQWYGFDIDRSVLELEPIKL